MSFCWKNFRGGIVLLVAGCGETRQSTLGDGGGAFISAPDTSSAGNSFGSAGSSTGSPSSGGFPSTGGEGTSHGSGASTDSDCEGSNPGCCGSSGDGCSALVGPAMCVDHRFTCASGTTLGPSCARCEARDAGVDAWALFSCETEKCDPRTQYCELLVVVATGETSGYCMPFPPGCDGAGGCTCLEEAQFVSNCTMSGDDVTDNVSQL